MLSWEGADHMLSWWEYVGGSQPLRAEIPLFWESWFTWVGWWREDVSLQGLVSFILTCRFQDVRSVAVGSWDRLLLGCLNKLWWNSDSWEDGWQWICCKWKQTPKFLRIFFLPIFFCNKTENKCQELSLQWIVISVFCDFCLYFISVLWFFLWFFSFSVFLFLFSDFHFFFAFWFLIFFVFRF